MGYLLTHILRQPGLLPECKTILIKTLKCLRISVLEAHMLSQQMKHHELLRFLSGLVRRYQLPVIFKRLVVGLVIAGLHHPRMIEIRIQRIGKYKPHIEILLVVIHRHMVAVLLINGSEGWGRRPVLAVS